MSWYDCKLEDLYQSCIVPLFDHTLTVHSVIVMDCTKSQCHRKLVIITMRLVRRQRETEGAPQELIIADFVNKKATPNPLQKITKISSKEDLWIWTLDLGPCLFFTESNIYAQQGLILGGKGLRVGTPFLRVILCSPFFTDNSSKVNFGGNPLGFQISEPQSRGHGQL